MLTTNPNVFLFFELSAEMRKSVYDACDKQTLGRLSQTCKQINSEINPVVEKVGQETLSPWDAIRKRHYPNVYAPAMRPPQNAMSLYKAVRLQDHRKRRVVLRKVLLHGEINSRFSMQTRTDFAWARLCINRHNYRSPKRKH